MTLLLTSRGIPQLYYGSEILMSGTRAEGGDANVRKDMPGGFPGDSISVFTREGRSKPLYPGSRRQCRLYRCNNRRKNPTRQPQDTPTTRIPYPHKFLI